MSCLLSLGQAIQNLSQGPLPLWLLEPVDGPGGEPGQRFGHSLQDLVGDLLEESVPPTCSTIQDRCHQVLEYVISALFHRFRGVVTSSLIGATRS